MPHHTPSTAVCFLVATGWRGGNENLVALDLHYKAFAGCGMKEEAEVVLELLDPNPDILALFCHYNDIYFHSKLHTCTVVWSSSRMTLCAGICKYTKGSCKIHLSEPLLKFRSSAELKATLLHEMIHAYLWLTDSNKDHEDHGPRFQKMMQSINDSQAVDQQRPEGGYHIAIYHEFSNEVNSYRKHHWMCTCCGDLIKRAHNRVPSQADCYQKIGQGNACINKLCHWHNHQQHCGGNYEKIAEPEGYKDRRPKFCRYGKKSAAENKAFKADKRTLKKNKGVLGNLTCGKIKNREGNTSGQMQKGASLEMYFATNNNGMRELATATKYVENCGDISTEKEVGGRKAQKRSRDYKGDETEVNGFSLTVNGRQLGRVNNFESVFAQKDKCTVVIGWKGWYAFESEEDEKNVEALNNKRSQRRMLDRACYQVQDSILGISATRSSFSGNREMVKSEKIKTLHDNTPSQPLLEDWDFGSMLLDSSLECHSVTYSSAKLTHTETAENSIFSYAIEKESPGEPSTSTIACESLSVVVPSCQETLASVSVKQTSLIDSEDCIIEGFANMKESKTVSLDKDGHRKLVTEEARSGKDLQVDDMEGGIDKGVEKPIQHKGRSKRLRKGGRFLTERGPSAACPICQRILPGDVEDANFNSKFNEHIDTCMGTSGT